MTFLFRSSACILHLKFDFACCPQCPGVIRQWPAVYDLRHTLLHVTLVKTHTEMRESHARIAHISRATKRCTKSDTSGHCLGLWEQSLLSRRFLGTLSQGQSSAELKVLTAVSKSSILYERQRPTRKCQRPRGLFNTQTGSSYFQSTVCSNDLCDCRIHAAVL